MVIVKMNAKNNQVFVLSTGYGAFDCIWWGA